MMRDLLSIKTKLFRGLADPSRLAILEVLREGAKNVSEIADSAGLSQPSASMHLDCLRCCGLIDREVRGRFRSCRIASKKLFRIPSPAEAMLQDVSQRIDECARYEARQEKGEQALGLNR